MAPGRARMLVTLVICIGGLLSCSAWCLTPPFQRSRRSTRRRQAISAALAFRRWCPGRWAACLAAAAAWAIGKISLGLRSDYLAIATLGIAEIVIAVMKNEDWLARGVKNIIDLPRPWPVPYEVELQQSAAFVDWATRWGFDPMTASSIIVKLMYIALFTAVLLAVIWLSERALNSPWGRMMRAIRDNEVSSAAMGKDVKRRHLAGLHPWLGRGRDRRGDVHVDGGAVAAGGI